MGEEDVALRLPRRERLYTFLGSKDKSSKLVLYFFWGIKIDYL
jgi:hypothetical protein